ncbi:HEAT repeat domain-containing protein [Dictyobacter arantiisoli]|nr:HEAT repeat domain-containing protein [Dictyobacter arantiisoli]
MNNGGFCSGKYILFSMLMTERYPFIRFEAVSAPGEWDAMVVGEPLIAVLSEPIEHEGDAMDVNVVTDVVVTLRKLNDKRALEPLEAEIERRDEQTRAVIALSLGSFGDMRAVEPLLNLLYDEEALIRRAAAYALGDLGDQRAVGPLMAILDDSDFETRSNVVKALGLLGDRRAVPPLIAALQQQEPLYRRVFIIEALDRLGDVCAVDALLERLQDPCEEKEVRAAAIEVLGHFGAKRAVPPLLSCLYDRGDDMVYEMRWRAAVALGQIGDTQAIVPLRAFLSDPEPVMRMAVSGALRQLEMVRVVASPLS